MSCRLTVSLCLLFATIAIAEPQARASETVNWTVATIAPEGSPVAMVLDEFMRGIEQVVAQSGVKLRIRTLHGGVVADEVASFELTKQGRTQLWIGSMGAAAPTLPALSIFDLPYVLEDLAAFERARARNLLDRPRIAKEFQSRNVQG